MIFIRYYSDLIVDKNIDDISDIKKVVADGYSVAGLYAVCVSPISSGLFVICSFDELIKEQSFILDYGVVAVCKGKKRAKMMVRDIVESWLMTHKELSGMKEYYNSECR